MGLKTISMKPSATYVDNPDLFIISQKVQDGYETKNLSYETLYSTVKGGLSSYINKEYNFGSVKDIDTQLYSPISSMLSGEIELSGKLTFETSPSTKEEQDVNKLSDNQFITKKTAEKINDGSSQYIGQESKIDCTPLNAQGYTHETNLISCYIDDSKRISKTTIICNHTGNLVLYGWLASNADVLPEECWVGLFTKMKNGDNQEHDTAIAIQPWIIGRNSQILQYVGFNVPVKEGMEITVRTGFNVNGTNSGFEINNSLILNGNRPNAFVGYIIHS